MEQINLSDKISFKQYAVEILFNENDTSNKNFKVVEQGWESIEYANSLTALMCGDYPVMGDGYILRTSLEDLVKGWKEDNAGYAYGFVVNRWLESKKISYRKEDEVEFGEVYRVAYDGLHNIFVRHTPYVDWTQNEYDSASHNRNGIKMLQHISLLQKCAAFGWNLRLVYGPNEENYFINPETGFVAKYAAYLSGDIDTVRRIRSEGIQKKNAYKTIVRTQARVVDAAENGTELPVRNSKNNWQPMDTTGMVLSRDNTLGRKITYQTGKLTLNLQHTVGDVDDKSKGMISWNALFRVLQSQPAMLIKFVDSEIEKPAPAGKSKKATKGRNVPEAI